MGLKDEQLEFKEFIDFNMESTIVNNMQKEKFYKFLEDNGFDVRLLTYTDRFKKKYKKKFDDKDFNLFNRLLLNAKEKYHFTLKECVLFLEEDYNILSTILSFLSIENKLILRKELIGEHNMKRNDTDINLFITW